MSSHAHTPSGPKAVLWDMDGTLIDSEPAWGEATYALSDLLGRPLVEDVRQQTIGGSFAETLRIVAQWAGYTVQLGDVERYRDWTYDRVGALLADGVEFTPGVEPLLASLRAQEVPMMVCTNTQRVLADRCLEAIGADMFVGSITGDEVVHPKPAPDIYLEAARRIGVDPSECLVFEDSWSGMTAAAAAGCRVLGLVPAAAGDSIAVPEGVIRFDPAEFVGADADDVSRWFAAAVG